MNKWWSKIRGRRVDSQQTQVPPQDAYVPSPDDYPSFPPPSPRAILKDPAQFWLKVSSRKYAAPQGVFQDTALYALYRLYEFIILDKVLDYRNALEAFWRQESWAVESIPDPEDADEERYAFLAGCTYLLVRSFNARIKLGLTRDMPSLITPEEAESARSIPDNLRPYEKVPSWASRTAALTQTLYVPTEQGEMLETKEDERADPDFLEKNIVLWTPHIHFT